MTFYSLSHTTMKQTMFNELKKNCLKVWKKYEWRPGNYYQEKVAYVKKVTNPDDYFVLIGMFDSENLADLYSRLSDECRNYYSGAFQNMEDICNILGA